MEQTELEHRLGNAVLDYRECRQHGAAADQQADDDRVVPPHDVMLVGLDSQGYADQDTAQAEREGDVPPPVDARLVALAGLAQLEVSPDRAVDAHRDLTQKTARQSMAASRPPATSPMNCPAGAAI